MLELVLEVEADLRKKSQGQEGAEVDPTQDQEVEGVKIKKLIVQLKVTPRRRRNRQVNRGLGVQYRSIHQNLCLFIFFFKMFCVFMNRFLCYRRSESRDSSRSNSPVKRRKRGRGRSTSRSASPY